jgi:hypothetical protein
MVDQRGLAAAGDHAELLDAGGAGLVDRVLNQGLVHNREHFLGHGLGGGEEAGAEASNGEHGFAQGLYQGTLSIFSTLTISDMGMRGEQVSRKRFFFVKKNQKTFALGRRALQHRELRSKKVLRSFFKSDRLLPQAGVVTGGTFSSAPVMGIK